MALSKVDRSLLRSYPELRPLVEEKMLDEIEENAAAQAGVEGKTSMDDPNLDAAT